jgi:hypothetical protein
MGRRLLLTLDIALKVVLIALLTYAVANPDLPQYSGKAMLGRALTFPIAAFLVPAVWWLRFRDRPYPIDVDLLFTAPFLIDVVGNALGLYDSIDWWDDANHFFNWMLITAGAALVIRSTGSSARPVAHHVSVPTIATSSGNVSNRRIASTLKPSSTWRPRRSPQANFSFWRLWR